MGESKTDFKTLLSAVMDTDAESEPHLTPEILVAYHHGRLTEPEADAALDHLAACRDCSDLLLELTSFENDGDRDVGAGGGIDDLESVRSWRNLSRRLEGDRDRETQDSVSTVLRTDAIRLRRLAYGLAASLVLATTGLGTWVSFLRSELETLRKPQVNIPIVHLFADGVIRGDGEEATVRGRAERSVVILNVPTFPIAVEHDVEILDSDGHRPWSDEGLLPTAQGTFHLELPRRLLPPDEYRIRLSRDGQMIAEFNLRVAP